MFVDPHRPSIVPRFPTVVIADKIKHIHFQKEQKSFSALMQPACTAVSTPCHSGQAMADQLRCVNVGNDYGKKRLYTPIRSKTTALPWCARHHSAKRERSSPPRRGDESAGKRSNRNCSSSPELLQSGFYSRYFLVPKKDGSL